jgi:drug/metabolite transporter (DMT)-like permease
MSLEAALWTLAATFLAGFSAFVMKVIAREGRSSALNGTFMYAGAAIAALIALPFYSIPVSWQMVTLYAIIAGVIYAVGNYLRIESLRHIDSVIYFPLNKVLGPLLIIVASIIFLGESLTWLQVIGVALSVSVPLLLVHSSEKHRQSNLRLGLILLCASTAVIVVSTTFMKVGVTLDSSVFFFMAVSQVAGFFVSMGIHVRTHAEETHFASLSKRRDWELGILSAAISAVALYALLKAMSLGQLSIVYTIHAHYILIPIILSVWWYGEHINMRKFLAVVVSFLAIGLLI